MALLRAALILFSKYPHRRQLFVRANNTAFAIRLGVNLVLTPAAGRKQSDCNAGWETQRSLRF